MIPFSRSHLVQLALVGQTLSLPAVLVDAHVVLARVVLDTVGSFTVGHHQGFQVAPLPELEPEERLGMQWTGRVREGGWINPRLVAASKVQDSSEVLHASQKSCPLFFSSANAFRSPRFDLDSVSPVGAQRDHLATS